MLNSFGGNMSGSNERRAESRFHNVDGLDDNNEASKHSLIIDISSAGAGLILRKKLDDISGMVNLNILKPDFSKLSGFKISAEIIWVDEDYDSEFRKMGVEFSNIDENLKNNISDSIEWFSNKDHHFLRCDVTQD